MDLSRVKDYMPLLKAAETGRTIQFAAESGDWKDLTTCTFTQPPCLYRVKPETIVFTEPIFYNPVTNEFVQVSHTNGRQDYWKGIGYIKVDAIISFEVNYDS